jgi:hypothetical protein
MSFESLDLDDAFENYMRKVNPTVEQHEAQFKESRRVWFAGAAVMHFHLIAMTMLSDDDGLKELMQLEKQLMEFKQRVSEGRD